MSKVKVQDFSIEMMEQVCNIINKGNQAEIKRERDNIVIIEIERHALSKNPVK